MPISTITAEFQCKSDELWEIVTSLEDYAWRSDLSKIVVLTPGKQFEEHTKDGYVTKFTITAFEPFERYEFDMENDNITGHWTGIFKQNGSQTEIVFTEDVTAKKLFMKPFVKSYIKKQQSKYISDLKSAVLSENQK